MKSPRMTAPSFWKHWLIPRMKMFSSPHFFLGKIVRQVNQPCHTLLRSATRIKRLEEKAHPPPAAQASQDASAFQVAFLCRDHVAADPGTPAAQLSDIKFSA